MTKHFRFRLQRVLELREEVERARAIMLAQAEVRAAAAREARDHIAAAREAGRDTVAGATTSGTTVGTLRQMQYVLGALDTQVQQADSSIVTADSVVRHAQDALRSAFQARRTLDTLREKQQGAHRAAEQHADRVLMDEIALTRFHTTDTSPPDPER